MAGHEHEPVMVTAAGNRMYNLILRRHVLQETETNFETDLFMPYIVETQKLCNKPYEGEFLMPYRVIADHIRACTFALADGEFFSNEGRGYVLRRLIRRAVRHGRKLGIEGKFLSEVADKVIESSKEGYPELEEQRVFIKKIIQQEEDRFSKTLNQGLAIINEYMDEMEKSGETVLSGEKAFKLHDTYGFPLEITEEILAERGYTADRDDFDVYMTRQKELGKSDAAKSDEAWKESEIDYLFDGETFHCSQMIRNWMFLLPVKAEM